MVFICGGEPLIYPHIEVGEWIARAKSIVYICTNACSCAGNARLDGSQIAKRPEFVDVKIDEWIKPLCLAREMRLKSTKVRKTQPSP